MVVEKGSFSTAAEALYVTQPTISVRIQMLEQELQNPMFNRISGRKVILTPAGEKVLPYFREAYDNITKCMLALKEPPYEQKTITIACPNHMGVEIMPELLKALYNVFPQIDFTVNISTTKEILEDIRSGAVDIGLGYIQSASDTKGLDAIHIVNEQNILVCAPEHPLTQTGTITTAELKKERIITYSKPFLTTQLVDQFLKKKRAEGYSDGGNQQPGLDQNDGPKRARGCFPAENDRQRRIKKRNDCRTADESSASERPYLSGARTRLQQEIRETVVCAAKKLFQQL